MIRFNNYPPTVPSDVEFSEGAREVMQERIQSESTTREEKELMFYIYGEAVGRMIIANIQFPDPVRAHSLFEPLANEVESVTGSQYACRSFKNGYELARLDAAAILGGRL